MSSVPTSDLTIVIVPSSALSYMEHLKEFVFLLQRGMSTDRWLMWQDGGSALHKRLIVGWIGGRVPSGGFCPWGLHRWLFAFVEPSPI